MKIYTKLSFLLLGFLVLLAGCERKWKKTASTTFGVEIHKVQPSPPLTITGGIIRLDKFEFEGKRQQGSDVFFSKEEDNLNSIDLATSTFLNQMNYDLPQGTYTEIRCKMRFKSTDASQPAVRIEGMYVNAANQSIPVVFESFDMVPLEIAQSNTQFVVVEDRSSSPTIHLYANEWFSGITTNQMENADLVVINSIPVLKIDEQNNSDLYELVFSRIGTIESLEFD